MKPKHVYRIEVEYPTPDGKPFHQQTTNFWEQIEESYFNPSDENPVPDWIPGLEEWSFSGGSYGLESTPNTGYLVTEALMVPKLNRTHYLTPSGVNRIARRFREWGCTVTIHKSKPIEWEQQ